MLVQRRLPLRLHAEVDDVALEAVVLALQRGQLRHQRGIAGRIEDDISDAEESEARRGRAEQQGSSGDPLSLAG